jgi:hypothetical protein
MRSFVKRGIVSSAKGVTVNVSAEANKPVSRGDRRGRQGGRLRGWPGSRIATRRQEVRPHQLYELTAIRR